jgi:hypothetical protein
MSIAYTTPLRLSEGEGGGEAKAEVETPRTGLAAAGHARPARESHLQGRVEHFTGEADSSLHLRGATPCARGPAVEKLNGACSPQALGQLAAGEPCTQGGAPAIRNSVPLAEGGHSAEGWRAQLSGLSGIPVASTDHHHTPSPLPVAPPAPRACPLQAGAPAWHL